MSLTSKLTNIKGKIGAGWNYLDQKAGEFYRKHPIAFKAMVYTTPVVIALAHNSLEALADAGKNVAASGLIKGESYDKGLDNIKGTADDIWQIRLEHDDSGGVWRYVNFRADELGADKIQGYESQFNYGDHVKVTYDVVNDEVRGRAIEKIPWDWRPCAAAAAIAGIVAAHWGAFKLYDRLTHKLWDRRSEKSKKTKGE